MTILTPDFYTKWGIKGPEEQTIYKSCYKRSKDSKVYVVIIISVIDLFKVIITKNWIFPFFGGLPGD